MIWDLALLSGCLLGMFFEKDDFFLLSMILFFPTTPSNPVGDYCHASL
jgi:hypothetical protein